MLYDKKLPSLADKILEESEKRRAEERQTFKNN